MRNLLLFFTLLIAACANPVNQVTADRYFKAGKGFAYKGQWFDARMAYSRAWTNATMGNLGDNVTASYAFEYGVASGAICDWPESEKGIMEALEIDKKIDIPIYADLAQLAFMFNAKGDLVKSSEYFSLSLDAAERAKMESKDPVGTGYILNEYAKVLSKLNKSEEAKLITTREQELHRLYSDKFEISQDIVEKSRNLHFPIGKYCGQKSSGLSVW